MYKSRVYLRTLFVLFALASIAPVSAQSFTPDKAGLEDGVENATGTWWKRIIVDKMVDIKLSPECWQKMTEHGGRGIEFATRSARGLGAYMISMGWGDLGKAESADGGTKAENRARVEQMVDEAKSKLHYTLIADSIKCTGTEFALLYRMAGLPITDLENGMWTPPNRSVFITFTLSPAAKTISVSTPDNVHYSIVAPSETELNQWDDIITKGLIHARPMHTQTKTK